jgi:hypothetical protein
LGYIAVTCNSAQRTGIENISGFLGLQLFAENSLEPEQAVQKHLNGLTLSRK